MTGLHRLFLDMASLERFPQQRLAVVVPAALALLLCCAVTFPLTSTTATRSHSTDYITAPVQKGSLQHILHEQGRIDSSDNYVVTSECEWTKAIIRLIPEGQWVEKGDIVVELDSSELQDRLRQREILIINAQAALVQAQEVVRLQKLENESAIAKAQLTKKLADLDLEKYIKGDFPKELKAAEGAVALAEEDVTRARERYEYVAYMAKKGYESPSAVEQERISTLKYEQALNKAKKALDLLVKYTSPRKIEELKSLASKAEMELARVDKTAELALANREILVTQRESQLKNHHDYADRMIRNIAACTIRAPVTGEIVYANEGSRRNEILEGEMVRNRQEVVRVPNLDQLEVDVRIHESQIEGIVNGLSASITLDAYPNLLLNGEVTSVSSVPTNGTGYNYDFKEYDVTVRLVGPSDQLEGLMPGLNAKVDIHVAERRDCLHIPAQSVVEIAGELVVFVNTDQGIEHRQIQVGMKSDTGVEVLSGLQQGEEVLLGPRTNCSEQIAVLREQFGSETHVDNIGG